MNLRTRTLTISQRSSYLQNSYVGVPSIVLSGQWLRAAGFDIGTKIAVKIEEGQLTISRLTNDDFTPAVTETSLGSPGS